MIKIFSVILISISIAGCLSAPTVKLNNEYEDKRVTKKLVLLGQPTEEARRFDEIKELHAEFQTLEVDLQRSISYAIKLQSDDFEKKRNWSTFGSLMGLVATTLNTASKANIVTSTAFTGLQTMALTRVSNSDLQIVHPKSYDQMQQSRKELEELYVRYKTNYELLLDPKLQDKDQWNALLLSTKIIFSEMRIKMAGILPPDKYSEKSNRLDGK